MTAVNTASPAAFWATSRSSAASLADDAWCCPPLGKDKARQPVDIMPVPLYFNDEMNQEGVQLPAGSGVNEELILQLTDAKGQFDERVPQRRHGTVSQRIA